MEFVHVGMDDDLAATIGHLPDGHGILGVLIQDPRPLRLPDLAAHEASYGFPPDHPPMHRFLGVPIRVGEQVFGNLYLTEKADGAEFTVEDEELVVALAASAAVAIENARLFAEAERRQRWLAASTEITRTLLDYHATDAHPPGSDGDSHDLWGNHGGPTTSTGTGGGQDDRAPLGVIARLARELADAESDHHPGARRQRSSG